MINEKKTLEEIDEEVKRFDELVSKANTVEGSIELARFCGVPEDKIIKSWEDLDRFFMG